VATAVVVLTALVWVLVRVVSTVVLPVTLPGLRFAQRVVTLELLQGAAAAR
jgi:ABC-type long-subunit fatty acid transport system fused permease/ATPase subunit